MDTHFNAMDMYMHAHAHTHILYPPHSSHPLPSSLSFPTSPFSSPSLLSSPLLPFLSGLPSPSLQLICAKALKPIPPTSMKTPLCNGSHAPKDHTPFLRQLIYSLRLVLNSILLYRISEE